MGFGGARPALPAVLLAACLTVSCSRGSSSYESTPAARAEGGSALFGSESPFLVMDINTAPWSPYSSLLRATEVGDTTFFVNVDSVHGDELWRTDGTLEGTRLVRDLFPGRRGASISGLTALKGRVLFEAEQTDRWYALWSSDGTPEGTVPLHTFGDAPQFPIVLEDSVLFIARGGAESPYDWGLWRTDGTAEGTARVKTLPGLGSNYVGYTYPARLGAQVLFASGDLEHGQELWRTDGTEAGTVLVKDIRPGSKDSNPTAFARLGDALLFWAKSDSDDFELWRTDGTAEGTFRLKAVRQNEYSSFPTALVSTGNAVYFSGWDSVSGQELWRSDGTAEGTRVAVNLIPGRFGSEPASLTAVGDTLFFIAKDELAGRELWKTDGTAAGTVRLTELPALGFPYSARFAASPEGTLFFMAQDTDSSAEGRLWKSDGTVEGTVRVTDRFAADSSGYGSLFWSNGRLFVRTSKGELWVSDGTDEGTRFVTPLLRGQPGSAPRWPVNMSGTLFFTANDGVRGEELWMSDGTREGTRLVADLTGGSAGSTPFALTPLNDTLLFLTGAWESGASGYSLWRVEGSGENVEYLMDVTLGSLVRMGDEVFFSRRSSSNYADQELWKTDGTRAGTVLVKAATGPVLGWKPRQLTAVGRTLYFVSDADTSREILWKSDGVGSNTQVVTDIGAGGYTRFAQLVAVGERLYFWASTQKGGFELWRTDGTAASTLPLMRLTSNFYDSYPSAVVGDTLFFIDTPSSGNGPELWKTSGGDPVRLAVLYDRASVVPAPQYLTAMNGALYFWAHDGVHGYELWKSDGTPEGTGMLKEIAPGAASAVGTPGPLVLAGPEGPLLFAASDGSSGLELWRTDGTAEGTVRVTDLAPGIASSSPAWMAPSGRYLYFQADDLTTGAELWALPRTVTDTTAPVLTCPAPPPPAEALGPQGTRVSYEAATATDDGSRPVLRYKPPPESDFPLGTTPVTVFALDEVGNRSSCTFDVVVRDTTPPTLTCPEPVRTEALGPEGAYVYFPPATATDLASTPRLAYSHASGRVFPVGESRVEVTATDGVGLTATCAFTVTVEDTQPPWVGCPAPLTAEATSTLGAEVQYLPPSAYDTVSQTEVEVSPAPGLFPLGTTAVRATARDAAGNSSQCGFSVTVRDTQPPVLHCPEDQRRVTGNIQGAEVTYPSATVSDLASSFEVKYSAPSGGWFSPGDTPVTVTATDAVGNQSSCTFRVRVEWVPPSADAGTPDGGGYGSKPPSHPDYGTQGCGCGAGGGPMSGLLGLALLGVLTRRRGVRG